MAFALLKHKRSDLKPRFQKDFGLFTLTLGWITQKLAVKLLTHRNGCRMVGMKFKRWRSLDATTELNTKEGDRQFY